MAPSPIPAPLPAWARFLLQLTPYVGGWLYDTLTYAGNGPSVTQWRKMVARVHSTATGAVTADDAFISWDLLNVTSGAVDNSWTAGDYTTAEGLFDTFFTTAKPWISSYGTLTEYRWYLREFNAEGESKPFLDSGPPQRVTTKSIVGTGSANALAQAAVSVTEKTPWPRHWGRFYLPFFPQANMTGARITTAVVDAIASACNTLYSGLATAELFPVVPVTRIDGDPVRALVGVTQVQVDDIPDVIRRRRPRNTLYRKILP